MSALVNIFTKYINPVFIETGAYHGDAIQMALEAGFKDIYSIEIDLVNYYRCWERFLKYKNVNIIMGDSYFMLGWLLKKIDRPVTFWLDGHTDDGSKTPQGKVMAPLLQELDAIKEHYIKTHTIIIDDLRCWDVKRYGWDTGILKEKILMINKKYEFIFEDGTIANDILVAKI